MSVRSRQPQAPVAPTRIAFDDKAMRDRLKTTMGPQKNIECHVQRHVQKIVSSKDNLLDVLNKKYMDYRKSSTPGYNPGNVTVNGNTLEYRSTDYMEHNLLMKITFFEDDNHAEILRMSTPNIIESSTERKAPPALPVHTEFMNATHHGCFRKLYENAASIERDWRDGAPLFSAIGVGLMAMKNHVSTPTKFTDLQSKSAGSVLTMYDIVMQLTALYTQAALTFGTVQSSELQSL
jgi:hypothetical protein